ncbi:uncharacterized protein LOC111864313 isoform X2 [Cryptotermes secundus]|uniref:uncharacterized protein LOC111864313 isoform X2 n=1 Tax=Cryptotermes secundus TaxID=105785 RepID=UPI000CD7D8D4|nr:uncharacterized protein LOC111864313 isoform X2 [Cryptotermes secundus]
MFEFDLGNEELIKWLLSCCQRKRRRLVWQVQNQLEQMGVSEESVKSALEQLSQDTKVYLQKFTLEEIRMYTQRHDNYEGGYRGHTEWFHSAEGSWPHSEKPSFRNDCYRKSHNSCDSFVFSQGYPEPLPREGNADVHWQSRSFQYADSRRYSERENHYHQPSRYGTCDAYSYRYRCRENNVDRHMRKDFYRRKRKIYPDHDSDGRRWNVCDRKMQKVEKQNIKSSVSEPINNIISEDSKDSEKVGSEVEKERLSSSKVHDSVACSGIKTDVTDVVRTSETSDVDEQTHSSTVNDQTETVVPYESGKDCDTKGKESRALIEENGKVCDNGNGEVLEEGVTAYKAQSISIEGGSVVINRNSSSTEEDEDHSSQREVIAVVNRVTTEVNSEQNTLEKEEPHCVTSEAEHHSNSTPSITNEEVSSVQQETKETSDASNESHGDFLGNSIQTSQDGNYTDIDEGTKDSASRKLSKKAEKSEHEIRKSQTVSTDFNDDSVNACEKAKYPSVSCNNPHYHKETASVQNHTCRGSGVVDCKTKVTEVGKTPGQSLGESEHTDETQILDIQRRVSVHVPSEHKGRESSHLKIQQNQQNLESRITVEDASHQGSKLQFMVSEIREASLGDNVKYKTADGSFHRNNKRCGTLIENASVAKSLEREVKSSKHLVSKEKCGMDHPNSSLSAERNKHMRSVTKYPGVRRTALQYYTTIDEYFGKNYGKSEDENNHNTKDSAENLRKIECTVNNQQKLVCENKFPVVRKNLEKYDEVVKMRTSLSKSKEKLAKMSGSQHASKCSMNVKRRSSEPCELLSKIRKKRRFSYGGGESVVKGAEMRPMGNDMKSRKGDEKMLEIDIPKLPKTGEEADTYGVSADSGTRMVPGGNETIKAGGKKVTKQGKRSSHCPEVAKAATQGIRIEKVTKMKPGEKVVKNRKNEEKVLEKETLHCSNAGEGVSAERGTKVNPAGAEIVKAGKDEENILGSSHCVKTSWHAAADSIQETTKIMTGGSESVKTGKNELKILKGSPQCFKTKEQAAVEDLSQKKTIKMKPGGRDVVNCCKNKGNALKKIPQCLYTEEKTIVQNSSRERVTKIKPTGNEMVMTARNEERIFKETLLCLRTEEQAATQSLSLEKVTKKKPRGSEMVKTGKKVEKVLEGPQNLKRGQQTSALSMSMEKATKNKPRSEMFSDRRKEEKILKGSPQHLEIEQSVVQSLSTEKRTKPKPGGGEKVKTGKNERKLKKSSRCFKTGHQASFQAISVERAIETKPRGSGIVNMGKNKVETLKGSPQRLKPGQDTAFGVSRERVHNTTALEMKQRGNELLATSSVKACRRDKQYHSFVSLNDCKRDKNGKLFSEKQNRRNTLERITNINPFYTSKLDFKDDKYRKKREIMLELFGEDPDELPGSKSDSPDGVCMKVLQESNSCSNSARVSNHSGENVKFASSLEQDRGQKDNGSTCQLMLLSCKSESESNSLNKGEVEPEHRDQQKAKGFGDREPSSLCPRSEVQKVGSQKLPQLNHSAQQNNHQQEGVCDSMTNRAGANTLQQNNQVRSDMTTHKNDMYAVTSRTTTLHVDTLGKSDHQKDTGPEACFESELLITCPMKDGTGTITQDNTQKQNGFGHQKSSDVANTNDIHLTGCIKEGENGEFHLIINAKNIDTLFPSPQRDHSGTTVKLLSVNCNILKDVNDASDGHSVSTEGVVHADKCSEDISMPSDTAERVAEKKVSSPETNVNVSTLEIPDISCSKVTGSVDKHVSPVPDTSGCGQNGPNNQHDTVERSVDKHVSPVPHTSGCGQNEPNNKHDTVERSVDKNVSSVPHISCCERNETDNQHHTVASSSTSEPLQDLALLCKRSVPDSSSQPQIFRMLTSAVKQTEVEIAGKEKCLSESNSGMRVGCSKASTKFPQSTVDLNQTQVCSPLQTNIPNSKETTSAMHSSRPTVRSDQLQPESFQANSKSTDDKPPQESDVPVSLTLPRIRVRDPESLGIIHHKKSFFKEMDTKLCELTQITYVLLQDMNRILHRLRAICCLTGTLKDTETALAKAEHTTHHQIVKAKTFLDLYKYVERSFSDESKGILIKRLSELNPHWTYTSRQLEMCQNYCFWVLRNSQMSVENLGSMSSQVTVSSVSLIQQILQHSFQQQPVGVPIQSNVASNTNNQVLPLLQARGQIPSSSEANINSKQQTSESMQNVPSIAPVLFTSSRNEVVTHTGGPATDATYDVCMRETGSHLNPRHAQTVNIPQQQLPNYNLAQTQNPPGRQFTYSNSISYIPQPVHETDRAIPLAQSQVLNMPPKKRKVPTILAHSYNVQHTTPYAVPNVPVSHGNRSAVSGFTGSVPVSGSGYSLPNSLSNSHAPNLQVAPSHYTSNNQNQTIQQRKLAYDSSRAAFKNPSNQHTYQHMYLRTLNKNSALNKSAQNPVNQPHSRNEAIQRDTFPQPVINTRNSSNQPYPWNEAIKQHTFSESVGNPPNTLQQGVSSHYMNNVAARSSAANSSSRPYVPNQVINHGMFSHQLSNAPSNRVTGGTTNVSLRELCASAAGPMGEVHGYMHPIGNRFCGTQQPPPRYIAPPPPYIPLSSSYTRVSPHAQKQVSVQEHHVSAAQGNTGSYNGASSGIPQQHQAPPVASELQMQLCGTTQSIISHRRGSHGRGNANDVASNNYCNGGITQNAPANNFFDRVSNQNGSPGNNILRNQLFDKEINQSRFLVNRATDNTLSDHRNTWSEPASNVYDKRKTHCEPASNSLSERGKNQYLSAGSGGYNSLFDGIDSLSGPVPNSTANNSSCEGENRQNVSLANGQFDRRNSQSRPLPNRTADNLHDRENNQTGCLPVITCNRLFDKGNSWSRPPAPANIPSSVTFQARFEGVQQHSKKPTQKLPGCEVGHQNVNNVAQHLSGASSYPSTENPISEIGQQNVNNMTQKHLSGAANVSSAENRNVNGNSGFLKVNTISEGTRLEDPQLESNSNITETPASLPNSQPLFDVNQQSSLCRSQQRQLSSIVTAQPELSRNTPVGIVQASGNPGCVPGSSAQATGISSTGHTAETLHLHVCEPRSTNHVTLSATVSEPPEKAVPDQQSTNSALRTEIQQETSGRPTLRTFRRKSGNDNLRNETVSVEVVDPRNDVQLETESECLGIDVTSKQSEEEEVTILTVEECVSISNSETSKTTTLNKIPAAMVDEAGGSDSEVEICEVLPQSRTVSRDSGYKTPSPMAGDVGTGSDQKEIPVKKLDFQMTENTYQPEDTLLVGEEYEDNKPLLEEDYKDSKLQTWFECEDAVSAAWYNTELTSLMWQESEVAVVREKMESVQCAVCEKPAEVKCSGCLVTCYCSAECQLEDWNTTHHTVCCAGLDE